MKKIPIYLVCTIIASRLFAAGVWNINAHLQQYTPSANTSGAVASWTRTGYAGWFDDSWANHQHMQIISGVQVGPSIDRNYGGLIYKFWSSAPVAMSININVTLSLRNYGGKKATVYFSDINNWEDLNTPLAGSRWIGQREEYESNPNWVKIAEHSEWTSQAYNKVLAPGTVYTSDGTFYVRVDLHQIGALPASIRLKTLSWNATVISPTKPSVDIWESNGNTSVAEGGLLDEYVISLGSAPNGSVTVEIAPDEQVEVNGMGSGEPVQVVFTQADHNPRTISVLAADDDNFESLPPAKHSARIKHYVTSNDTGYNEIKVNDVLIDILDNDRECGDPGTFYNPADLNFDCKVDLSDFALMVSDWMLCNDPEKDNCIINWP